jgi:hypothetical protein
MENDLWLLILRKMKVVKDSYILINFYFVENMQSQMTQTPIKYFKGELKHVLQKGMTVSYNHICHPVIHRELQNVVYMKKKINVQEKGGRVLSTSTRVRFLNITYL